MHKQCYSFGFSQKEYIVFADELIKNQICKNTVENLIYEINKFENHELIKVDDDCVLYKLSEEALIFVKSIIHYITDYYRIRKLSLPEEVLDINAKKINFIKLQVAKCLCQTIINLMDKSN